ncbi:MFS transporter [Leisingera sp. ANG-M1]|uniref:MFS transporter n=1 Tax=Leisingera sp. ANG-M1 TaxID=1577895 RepID=UPI00068BA835|nr:MFS transporter [Leisingera sp. ANG-M1]
MSSKNPLRWWLLLVVSSGLLLITLDNSILYTALPTLAQDLGASQSELLWIINAYPLVMAGLLLGAGTLGDRVGHRRIFLIGLAVFGTASTLAAFSPSPEILISARGLLAVGAAMMMPATLALIRVTFDDQREQNLAYAIWGMLAIVGSALGPIIGGLLLGHFWWGSVFLINIPVVAAAFVGTLILAPRVEPDPSKTWDFVSSAQAMVMLAGFVVAIKELTQAKNIEFGLAAVAVSVIAAILFVRRQKRLTYPLLDFSVFKNPALMSGVLAAAFALFAIAGIQLTTTQRFQIVEGFTPIQAGYLVSIIAISCIPLSLIGGAYLHRIGLRILITGGLATCSVAAVITAIGFGIGLPWLICGLVIMGFGVGAALSVASTAILGNAPIERAGMAGAVEEVSYELGSLLAVALLGSLTAALYSFGASFPEGTPAAASDSIIAAWSIAEGRGEDGQEIFAEAARAFDQAYVMVLYVIAGVLAIGALVTAVLLRDYGVGSSSTIHDWGDGDWGDEEWES